MNNLRDNLLLAATALVLSAAWVLAWIAGLGIDVESSLIRGGLVMLWLLLVGGTASFSLRRTMGDLREARRSLETLAGASGLDLAAGAEASLPLAKDNPWFDVVHRVRQSLSATSERAENAEHQRFALEIRARRSAAQCDRINAVLQGLAEPVLVVDDYDELVLANASAEKLFNFNSHDPERRALSRLVRCEKLLDMLGESRRRKSLAPRADEVELADVDGGRRWYSITANSLSTGSESDNSQTKSGAVAVLRDISGQKAIQKRNAEFVSAVSHEMRTPLAGIKAYVELLADGDTEDEQTREEFLGVINGQADRLKRLIDNLLNLSRIEAGVVTVNKRNLPLNDLLEEAANVVRPSAAEKKITLISDLSPMYLGAFVDRDQMLQAAINLLSNAIKYTQPEGRVTLRSRLQDKEVQFDVEDTGVGLSPEDQVKVFEKFYRVQKDKQMAPGTGLGLPLAKSIVEEVHGGRLTLKSELGVGSTFTVTLPGSSQIN